MEGLASRPTGVPLANQNASSVLRHCAAFIALGFGISWLIWISVHRLGARPGVGEEFLAFGSAGPAAAAIFLSRTGRKVLAFSLATRLLWFGLLWPTSWVIYVLSDKLRGVTPDLSRFGVAVALLAVVSAWIGPGVFPGTPECAIC